MVGVGNVYSGVVGISSQSTVHAALAVLAALGGIARLVLAVRTWRRRLFAWRLGFGLITWGGTYTVLGLIFTLHNTASPTAYRSSRVWKIRSTYTSLPEIS